MGAPGQGDLAAKGEGTGRRGAHDVASRRERDGGRSRHDPVVDPYLCIGRGVARHREGQPRHLLRERVEPLGRGSRHIGTLGVVRAELLGGEVRTERRRRLTEALVAGRDAVLDRRRVAHRANSLELLQRVRGALTLLVVQGLGEERARVRQRVGPSRRGCLGTGHGGQPAGTQGATTPLVARAVRRSTLSIFRTGAYGPATQKQSW